MCFHETWCLLLFNHVLIIATIYIFLPVYNGNCKLHNQLYELAIFTWKAHPASCLVPQSNGHYLLACEWDFGRNSPLAGKMKLFFIFSKMQGWLMLNILYLISMNSNNLKITAIFITNLLILTLFHYVWLKLVRQ